jgi:hypothetical protein
MIPISKPYIGEEEKQAVMAVRQIPSGLRRWFQNHRR